MNIFNIKKDGILWILALIPCAYIIYIWPQLPDRIPIHFDLHGHVNGWGGRAAIFLMPGMGIFVYVLTALVPLIDPKKMNKEFFEHSFFKIRVVIIAALSAISILISHLSISAIPSEKEVKYLPVIILLLLSVMGNFMINIKPNWFVGVRTPWTLSSDVVWKKTHLVFGRVWFYGGLLSVVAVLLLPDSFMPVIILVFALGSAAFGFAYSYLLYRKEQQKVSGS